MPLHPTKNNLFYGDNLEVLRRDIRDEAVDLCYIDPPFNSKRNYNQIYNNIGTEDPAQAQAFTDTWTWDTYANEGFSEILGNAWGRYQPQTIELIKGLHRVLKEGSLLAYLVSMTRRFVELHRVLRPTGSFYLHCDPTASHYLKLVLDTIFVTQGGDFKNEIIWHYGGWTHKKTGQFPKKHDVLLYYTKSARAKFQPQSIPWTREEYIALRKQAIHKDEDGREYIFDERGNAGQRRYLDVAMQEGRPVDSVWDLRPLTSSSKERMGYPTQKPEALLERVIRASSNENDMVLDAYCGCGTTIAVAERLKRRWTGIDITYQSIALVLRRLEDQFGKEVLENVARNGIPRDMASARALAQKQDDRLRKEFEKWAILTYTNNRAIVNDKKGADAGIDGVAYFQTGDTNNASMIFQVKSGHVDRGDIAKLRGDMSRVGAALATLITLNPPTAPMIAEAKAAGVFRHDLMGRTYDKIQTVTVQDIVERGKRLDIPMNLEVLRSAQQAAGGNQLSLF